MFCELNKLINHYKINISLEKEKVRLLARVVSMKVKAVKGVAKL
jgi:hypothetical protein